MANEKEGKNVLNGNNQSLLRKPTSFKMVHRRFLIEGKCEGVWTLTTLHPSSRSNWNLVVMVFVEGGKPKEPGEEPSEQGKN